MNAGYTDENGNLYVLSQAEFMKTKNLPKIYFHSAYLACIALVLLGKTLIVFGASY